jgi:hypothetical protein
MPMLKLHPATRSPDGDHSTFAVLRLRRSDEATDQPVSRIGRWAPKHPAPEGMDSIRNVESALEDVEARMRNLRELLGRDAFGGNDDDPRAA